MRKLITLTLVMRHGFRDNLDYKVIKTAFPMYTDRVSGWSDQMIVLDGNRFEVVESAEAITAAIVAAEKSA